MIHEEDININVPSAPLIAYSRQREKQLIHIFTIKNVDKVKNYWVTDSYKGPKKDDFNIRMLIKDIKQVEGSPSYYGNIHAYNFEAEDEETAKKGRPESTMDRQ